MARSLTELEEPFATSGHFAGLDLERTELTQAPDPFWGEFQQAEDAKRLGLSRANMVRAVLGPNVLVAINTD